MQMLSAKPLIEKFKNNDFKDEEVAPYFIAYVTLEAITYFFLVGEMTSQIFIENTCTLLITIFGVLYLKRQNNNSFANGFLNKWFSLGWVITVRMFLMLIPICIAFAIFVPTQSSSFTIFFIFFQLFFYWWLGQNFIDSQSSISIDQEG